MTPPKPAPHTARFTLSPSAADVRADLARAAATIETAARLVAEARQLRAKSRRLRAEVRAGLGRPLLP